MSVRAFDILAALLKSPGQIIRKDDLLDAVWPGQAVEENTLHVHISALRRALGPRLIATIHGRGYKYAGPDPIAVETPADTAPAERPTERPGDRTSSTGLAKPLSGGAREYTSVAVLPLKNLSADASQEIFIDGLAEDIITELARYRHLSVTGHRLSSPFGNRRGDLAAISRELGVEFIIDGSLRLSGNRLRVSAQLIEVESGRHVWGDHFEREMTDIFAVQDEIVGAVIGRLALNLDEAAGKKRLRDPTSSSSAYTCFLQARAAWRQGDEKAALDFAAKAVAIDPDYARAWAYLAHFHAYGLFNFATGLSDAETISTSTRMIEKALAIDGSDPFVLQRAAITYLMLGEPQTGRRYAEAAALESARDSEILVFRGFILACCGNHMEGVRLLEEAIALEKRLAPGNYSSLSEVRHMQRDYAGSLEALDAVPNPPFYFDLLRAANLARLGRRDEARRSLARIPAGIDTARIARNEARICALPEDAEHWLESFRLAGVEV
ncbi:MAG: winged helix-turn-helix domain-containing protein [Alphaproteobacteria bacterium]|nr:winged helix-turn-helix domain-containing protein [Alphaproteobacteria bacterium]